jgi:predicted Ser/Thr protein kinase
LRDRLAAQEAERDEIEAEIAAVAPPAVEFHPNAANDYRDKVRSLKKTLAEAEDDSRLAANEAIREIVEKVMIHRVGDTSQSRLRFTASSPPHSEFLKGRLPIP